MKMRLTESQLRNTIRECIEDVIYESIRDRVKQTIRENINKRFLNEDSKNPFRSEKQTKEDEKKKRAQTRISREEKTNIVKKRLMSDEINMAHYARSAFPQCTDAGARSYLVKCLNGDRDWPEGVIDKLYTDLQNS